VKGGISEIKNDNTLIRIPVAAWELEEMKKRNIVVVA